MVQTKINGPLFFFFFCLSFVYFVRVTEALSGGEQLDDFRRRRASEIERRYISYETLIRDLVPCDTPGASYYNCRGGGIGGRGEANFYNRGCQIITRCARG
ncbi:rapid alkalinization factor 1 [Genlisea aurea]|uniref:Rapid alkalinization factor 1 n=1 Tax=Genlisea aurea TaxID=192259 RepID=S8E6P6_9LAMI|nr:rapid alkalinization factor 1 [Genlisea aurea]